MRALLGLAVLLAGALLARVGATNLSRERAVQRGALRLPGVVVGDEWRAVGGGDDGKSLLSFPVVRYSDPTGTPRTFLSDVGTSTVTRHGTPVEVLHDAAGGTPPQLAGFRSRTFLPAGVLLLGSALALLGAAHLLVALV